MKTIELKKDEIAITPGGEKKPISTKQLIEAVLNYPPKDGFTFQDLKTRQRIDAAVAAAGEGSTLQLEDADYQTLKEAAQNMRWLWRADFIIDFVTSVTA